MNLSRWSGVLGRSKGQLMNILDTVLLAGIFAAGAVVVGTLIFAAIGIWLAEFAEVHVRAVKRWARQRLKDFLEPDRAGRVVQVERA